MCKEALNETQKSGDKAGFPADSKGSFFSLPATSVCSSSGFYYLPSCLFSSGKKKVRESSVSESCKIHLIMAAFPHLLPINHYPFLYFTVFLIHLYTSHYLPHHHPLSHSVSF